MNPTMIMSLEMVMMWNKLVTWKNKSDKQIQMKLHLLEYMNICELLLSAFGIWQVESEDAKNRSLCFLTSEFLASITVSPHIRRKHQIDDEHQKRCAIVPPVTSCKSGYNVSLVLKVHTALEILQAF